MGIVTETMTVKPGQAASTDTDLDTAGIVRMEIVHERGLRGPLASFRLSATVELESESQIEELKLAFQGKNGPRTPRDVISSSGATMTKQFQNMTPDHASPDVIAEGTGGVPNFMLTADLKTKTPRYLFTTHTEVFLKRDESAVVLDLLDAIASRDAETLANFLRDNGKSVRDELLRPLLHAALD